MNESRNKMPARHAQRFSDAVATLTPAGDGAASQSFTVPIGAPVVLGESAARMPKTPAPAVEVAISPAEISAVTAARALKALDECIHDAELVALHPGDYPASTRQSLHRRDVAHLTALLAVRALVASTCLITGE